MNFLLFDENALNSYVSATTVQSIEYSHGQRFIDHIRKKLQTEIFEGTVIEYCDNGVIFLGKDFSSSKADGSASNRKIFCIDLDQCKITAENDATLLFILQKIFRTALKIWNRQPFSFSERVHETKSIVFPFTYPDPRRIVIERSKSILQLDKRGIDFPLLAYKYNAEEPPQDDDDINTNTLKNAGKLYCQRYYELKRKLQDGSTLVKDLASNNHDAMHMVEATKEVLRSDFIYCDYEQQYKRLTISQKEVVDYAKYDSPLRIDGAAGTGKTMSMIMRAYRMLEEHRKSKVPFNIIFFAHSQSTFRRNVSVFQNYPHGNDYLREDSSQHISFITLSDFCLDFSGISPGLLAERDAGDAKAYQLMIIENVVEKAIRTNRMRTYRSFLSQEMKDAFNQEKTALNALLAMLQHEFSIQIKGRTDSTIDKYYEIPSIPNGLPCKDKKDKDFVFSLFCDYQNELKSFGAFDLDDVVMETLSRLNAPVWRRERTTCGYDYIFVDEMHLFNINEQSVFHFLTRNPEKKEKEIPICFALDYSQAIGDRGDVQSDYLEKKFGTAKSKKYNVVFRNSPQITDFCAAIAASGVMMFNENFSNPYSTTPKGYAQNEEEERKSKIPFLYLYDNDEDMLNSLSKHINNITKALQCKPWDIAIIAFDSKFCSADGIENIRLKTGMDFQLLTDAQRSTSGKKANGYVIASPYDINGLEFQAVILIGVDEGRVPQTTGTSDISQHFIKYSAYNLLYLAASRAKYRLIILGNQLKGISSCLIHSIETKYLEVAEDK